MSQIALLQSEIKSKRDEEFIAKLRVDSQKLKNQMKSRSILDASEVRMHGDKYDRVYGSRELLPANGGLTNPN